MEKNDLHKFNERLKREIELLEKSKIVEENKKLILKFKRDLIVEGVGIARIGRYMRTLRVVCERWKNKPFIEWDKDDIKDVLVEIETNGYTAQTINEFRKGLRKFFKWLKGENWEGLKLLRGERKDNRKPDVLTEEEIMKMIEAAKNPRDKAIIAVGYEAGLRIGELANLRWKDVIWTEHGAKIKVHGKTGERVIPIVMAAPYLTRWMQHHPHYDMNKGKPDPNAFVFVNIGSPGYGEPMEYKMLSKVIKKAAKNAGIDKRVYPHILRHSRATVLANYLTEAQMNQFFGWVQGSDMPRIYVHLSGRDIDKAINKIYGLEVEEEEKEKMAKPVKCPRCGYLNAPTDKYCGRCTLILDEKERLRIQMEEPKMMGEIMNMLLQNPELMEKFKEMLKIIELVEQSPEAMKVLLNGLQRG